ncbi:MAG: hypothetical protein AABY22_05430, partial [Nanoarchaeota archaeon]
EEIVPLELNSEKEISTAYDMYDINSICLKLDILGLRASTLVSKVCELTKTNLENINIEDSFIYDQLQNLECPHGLFQIEADTNLRVVQKIKPKNLSQLAASTALSRPGALSCAKQYTAYVQKSEYKQLHPFFDDILKETGFLAIFQENLMKMLNKIGFSLDEAEICRKIIGKKLLNEVNEWKDKIYNKVKENKLDKEIADTVWKILSESVNYSFCAAHAYFYSVLSAQTIWLKFKYPKEFFLALLELSQHEPEPFEILTKIQQELKYFNIQLLPPSLDKSSMNFTIENSNIRMGLSAIKGVSDKVVEKLKQFQRFYPNKFELFECANQSGLSIGVLSALIGAGCLDLPEKRTRLILESNLWWLLTEKEKRWGLNLGAQYNYNLIEIIQKLKDMVDEKNKPIIKLSRYGTIKKHYKPFLEIYKINSQYEELSAYWMEYKLLGYSYSQKLKDIFAKVNPNLIEIAEIKNLLEKDKCQFVGIIDNIEESKTKRDGTKYIKYKISDNSGYIIVITYGDEKIAKNKNYNNEELRVDDIVFCKGVKGQQGGIFSDFISKQRNPVFFRYSELEKELKKINNQDVGIE